MLVNIILQTIKFCSQVGRTPSSPSVTLQAHWTVNMISDVQRHKNQISQRFSTNMEFNENSVSSLSF